MKTLRKKIEFKSTDLSLPILIEQDEDNVYIVSCPVFKGCHSYGKTVEEALENIKEVIEICLDETPVENLNRFVGYREIRIPITNSPKKVYA
ncbi:MAG: type II toxin-antitoxin system HicB family antitoxin [Bacteroidetes bacterium]|nr:type II toxin-antitoxin system HicB family antitoxin [Bacteroidota bacterium]